MALFEKSLTSSTGSAPSNDMKDRILDSFEDLLLFNGERATTIEQVAEHCGITRGGLIYHFASRHELLEAFIARLQQAGVESSGNLLMAPEGPVERYILSAGPPLSRIDRTMLAAARLANDENPRIREVLLQLHRQWVRVLTTSTGDEALSRLLLLLGDGVLFHSSMTGKPFALGEEPATGERQEREELIELVRDLIRWRGAQRPGEQGLLG